MENETHYEKYKDVIKKYNLANREKILEYGRNYQKQLTQKKREQKEQLIIQKYLQTLIN